MSSPQGSAANPVRLDPIQHVIGVGWGGFTHIAFSMFAAGGFTFDQGGACTPRDVDYGPGIDPSRSSEHVLSQQYGRSSTGGFFGRRSSGHWQNLVDLAPATINAALPDAPGDIGIAPWTIFGGNTTATKPKTEWLVTGGMEGEIDDPFGSTSINFLTGGGATYETIAPSFTSGPACTAAWPNGVDTGANVEEALLNGAVTDESSWVIYGGASAPLDLSAVSIEYHGKTFVFDGLQIGDSAFASIPGGNTIVYTPLLDVLLKRDDITS
jgi:hypothetical protein